MSVKCPYCQKALHGDERWCNHCENDISKHMFKHDKPKCFIATAAFGSPFIYEVQVLRNFRDEKLDNNLLGRLFIKSYYKLSPPIANVIEKNNLLKNLTKKILSPIVKIILKFK